MGNRGGVGAAADGGVVVELEAVEDEVLVGGSGVVGVEVTECHEFHAGAGGFECAGVGFVICIGAEFHAAGVGAGERVEIDFHIDDATAHFRAEVDHVLAGSVGDHDAGVAAESSVGGHDAEREQFTCAEGGVGRGLEVDAGEALGVVDIEAHGKCTTAELLIAIGKRAVARVGAAGR